MAIAFIPIYYSGFWDVPYALLTVFDDKLYYFQRRYFDDELGDYPPNWQVSNFLCSKSNRYLNIFY
jgi:hypothetical protein